MINLDALPQESGSNYTPKPDVYLALIEKAEMRTPKPSSDGTKKPDYLSLQYRISKFDGSKAGVMFDSQYESDKQAVQYKLTRFLKACGIPLQGQMELKDIATLVLNKQIVVDTKIDESSNQPRLQVDLFGREAYYPKEQFEEIWRLAHPEEGDGFTAAPAGEEPFMQVPEGADTEEEY